MSSTEPDQDKQHQPKTWKFYLGVVLGSILGIIVLLYFFRGYLFWNFERDPDSFAGKWSRLLGPGFRMGYDKYPPKFVLYRHPIIGGWTSTSTVEISDVE